MDQAPPVKIQATAQGKVRQTAFSWQRCQLTAGLLQLALGSIAASLVQDLLLQLACACARKQGKYPSQVYMSCATAVSCLSPRPPPSQVDPDELRKLKRVDAAAISKKQKLSEMDVLAVVQNDSTYLEVGEAQ